jgi:predicted metal-binding membrane protein
MSMERRLPALLVLLGVAGACWAVTVERMQGMDMGPGTALGGLGWFVVVWVTMMAAMMLPSLSPLAVASTRSIGRVAVFSAGYLMSWLAFGLVAYALVDGVRALDLGFLAWSRAGRYLAAGVLLGAALYELTEVKRNALRHCRDARLLRDRGSALLMGVEQGGYCVGCSGALMAALFALGVMSVAWMLVIAALVAIEKLLPWAVIAVDATALTLVLLGIAVLVAPSHVPWLTIPM